MENMVSHFERGDTPSTFDKTEERKKVWKGSGKDLEV